MNPKIAPCKDCTEKYAACHDKCAKFAQWKAEQQKVKVLQKEYKKQRREDYLRSEECESTVEKWRCRRKHGR